MIVRIVEMHIDPFKKQEVVRTFKEIKESVRQFKGCHYVGLFENINSPEHIITYSIWDSEEDLEHYRNSPVFERNWKLLKMFFIGKPKAYSLKLVDECLFLPCDK